MVACRQHTAQLFSAAVEDGVAAYAWLLGEGCDANTTVFSSESFDEDLVAGIVELAGSGLGLPIPADQTRDRHSTSTSARAITRPLD